MKKITGFLIVLAVCVAAFGQNVRNYMKQGGSEWVVKGTLDLQGSGKLKVGGLDHIAYTDTTVSTAELLALNTTAKTLVSAAGAGTVIVPKSMVFWLDYNSTAYNGIADGEDLAIKYSNSGGVQISGDIETTGFLDGTADEIRVVVDFGSSAGVEAVPNSPLVLHMLSGNIATGNSPLKVRTYYEVVPSSW